MSGGGTTAAGLVVVGTNHRSSTAALRDRIFVDDTAAPAVLEKLRAEGISEAIVLSTCDRVEIDAIHSDSDEVRRIAAAVLAEHAALDAGMIEAQLYMLAGDSALEHLFAVASSLESQVIGEPQVLGQVKAAHRLARGRGMTGPALDAVMDAAYGAAKRVRTETRIGERPVSIAAAAVQIARDVHGDPGRVTALLLGGGDMGEFVAEQLLAAGLGRLLVTAPSLRRAEAVARRFDCHIVPWEGFATALPDADIILASVGARRYLIGGEMIEQALKHRRRRPLFLVDLAVPGDIGPEVERIEEAFLYDLDDLERVALDGRATRAAAAEEARAIVSEELAAFRHGRAARGADPAITRLRARFEAERARALREAGGDAERATRLLINRLLHDPSAALREIAAAGEGLAAERILRRLFRLGRASGEDGPEEERET